MAKLQKTSSRFEWVEQENVAYADYRLEGENLLINYVFAPDALRGTGAAGRLMHAIKEYAATENLQITPICGYAASWLKRHA